jgi:hypothetical protein
VFGEKKVCSARLVSTSRPSHKSVTEADERQEGHKHRHPGMRSKSIEHHPRLRKGERRLAYVNHSTHRPASSKFFTFFLYTPLPPEPFSPPSIHPPTPSDLSTHPSLPSLTTPHHRHPRPRPPPAAPAAWPGGRCARRAPARTGGSRSARGSPSCAGSCRLFVRLKGMNRTTNQPTNRSINNTRYWDSITQFHPHPTPTHRHTHTHTHTPTHAHTHTHTHTHTLSLSLNTHPSLVACASSSSRPFSALNESQSYDDLATVEIASGPLISASTESNPAPPPPPPPACAAPAGGLCGCGCCCCCGGGGGGSAAAAEEEEAEAAAGCGCCCCCCGGSVVVAAAAWPAVTRRLTLRACILRCVRASVVSVCSRVTCYERGRGQEKTLPTHHPPHIKT